MVARLQWASKAQRHGRFVYHEKKWARVLEVVLFKLLAVALLGTSLLPVTCNASLRVPSLPENAALLVPGNTCEAMRPHMFSGVLAATVQVRGTRIRRVLTPLEYTVAAWVRSQSLSGWSMLDYGIYISDQRQPSDTNLALGRRFCYKGCPEAPDRTMIGSFHAIN